MPFVPVEAVFAGRVDRRSDGAEPPSAPESCSGSGEAAFDGVAGGVLVSGVPSTAGSGSAVSGSNSGSSWTDPLTVSSASPTGADGLTGSDGGVAVSADVETADGESSEASVEDGSELDGCEPEGSASAMPGTRAAAPTPKATASAPTRPTNFAFPTLAPFERRHLSLPEPCQRTYS